MNLNLDIWYEIISYLEYPNDEATLRSLAITSRMLCNLALDITWRNGEKLPTIVSVINSFAASPDEPFLEYTRGGSEESNGEESNRAARDTSKATWVSLYDFACYPKVILNID